MALGLRKLRSPSAIFSVTKPFVKMRIGSSSEVTTIPSSRPLPTHCNFSEVLEIKDVVLPDDEDVAPFLDIKVFDKVSMGMESLLGTGSFCLDECAHYAARRGLTSASSSRRVGANSPGRREGENEEVEDLSYIHEAPYMKDRKVLTDELHTKPLFSVIEIFRAKKKAVHTETTK